MHIMHVVMRVMRRWVAECSDTCLATRAVNAPFDARCDAAKDVGSERQMRIVINQWCTSLKINIFQFLEAGDCSSQSQGWVF